jgi:hypothetical protein
VNRILSIFFGLYVLAVACLLSYQPVIPSYTPIKHDFRVTALLTFMQKHNFSKPYYVSTFLRCADSSKIDWRLLPSIALQESSGFKRYPILSKNGLGWNSAHYTFQSIEDSICFVSDKLGNGGYYKGKSITAKLHAYNPNPEYSITIQHYMNEISSSR